MVERYCPDKEELFAHCITDDTGAVGALTGAEDIVCNPNCAGPVSVQRQILGRTSLFGFEFGTKQVCTQNLLPDATVVDIKRDAL